MNAGRWIRPRIWSFSPGFTSLLGWWSLQRPVKWTRLRGAVRQPVPIGAIFIPVPFSGSLDPGGNWAHGIFGFVLVAIFINSWVLLDDAKIVQRTPFASEPAPCPGCGSDGTVIQLNAGVFATSISSWTASAGASPVGAQGAHATFRTPPEPARWARPGLPLNRPALPPLRRG